LDIYKNEKYSSSVIIGIILFGLYLLSLHAYNLYDIFHRMSTKTRYPKEFGIFLIMIAIIVLVFNIYMLIKY